MRTSRAIARAAVTTLRRNPGLLWFPALSLLVHGGFAMVCVLVVLARGRLSALAPDEFGVASGLFDPSTTIQVASVASGLAVVGFQLVAVAFAVAMTHAALEALASRSWSVSGSMGRAWERRGAVAGFAVLRLGSGILLGEGKRRHRRRRGGKRRRHPRPRPRRRGLLAGLARMAWWAATYLTIPVLAHEDRGAIGSIGRSATLFRETWREGVVGRWMLGWLWIPWILGGAIPLVVLAGAGVEDERIWLAGVVLMGCAFGLGGVVVSTVDTIYRAALYVFATEGVIPSAFDDPDLHVLWETSPAEDPET